MAIEIKEYLNSNSYNVKESKTTINLNINENLNVLKQIPNESIIQIIEGIHVGPTRNFTWYTKEALLNSIESWTKPYNIPLIKHHNEKNGDTIGRILNANYKRTNTRSKTPALEFTCLVSDKDGIQQIKDRRLETVSIGVIAHDVRCSICGEQVEIIDEYGNTACGHSKGSIYDNETCYWKIYSMEAKELSYVIVPSDIYAHNIKTIDSNEYNKQYIKENLNNSNLLNIEEGVNDMSNNIQENKLKDTIIEEEVTNKELENIKDIEPIENKEIKELKESNELLKKQIEELEKEKEEYNKTKEAINKELEEVKEELTKALDKIEVINADLIAKEKQVEEEIALKEAVENELGKIKVEIREARESEFNILRASLNKEVIAKEALSKRSDDSLMDSILDLKEEMNGIRKLKEIKETANPVLDNEKNKNNNTLNVKENKTVGNMNLEEGLKEIFSDMFNPIYNY